MNVDVPHLQTIRTDVKCKLVSNCIAGYISDNVAICGIWEENTFQCIVTQSDAFGWLDMCLHNL